MTSMVDFGYQDYNKHFDGQPSNVCMPMLIDQQKFFQQMLPPKTDYEPSVSQQSATYNTNNNEINNILQPPPVPPQKKTVTHNEERTVPCTYCAKLFRNKAAVDQHERIHTGVRPYKCSFCEKSFKQLSHQLQHERIHTNVRPYACNECGSAYRQKNHLNAHIKRHEQSTQPLKRQRKFKQGEMNPQQN